jgi:hypothetical protein
LKNEENAPIFKTVSGQALNLLGKYEFPVTINKDHTFLHSFYVINNLKENCILGIDFLSQNNVKINTKNRQLNYDHAEAEQILESDYPIYSIKIGNDQTEIPLTPYNQPRRIIRKREIKIPDNLIAHDLAYERPIILNQNSPNHIHPTDITGTDDEGPNTADELRSLLPFEQFNSNNEVVSTVPISEFDLSHLDENQRRTVLYNYTSLNEKTFFPTKKEI